MTVRYINRRKINGECIEALLFSRDLKGFSAGLSRIPLEVSASLPLNFTLADNNINMSNDKLF
jgi:hypothetical protein